MAPHRPSWGGSRCPRAAPVAWRRRRAGEPRAQELELGPQPAGGIGDLEQVLLSRELDLEQAADRVAGGHRIVRQLDRLEHAVERCGHVVRLLRFSAAHRRRTHHETFHGREVGVERVLRSGHLRGRVVADRLGELGRPRRAGTACRHRRRAEPSARDADAEEHPAAIGELLGGSHLADRADRHGSRRRRRPRCRR